MSERDDRVLAVMLKAPFPGRVKTRLASAYPAESVVALYKALVEDTLDLAISAGLRTVAVCPSGDEGELSRWLPPAVDVVPQRGSGLAAALDSTFEQLCTSERRRVIAFNADSPHLPISRLESAFAALTGADVVIGPCDDGGYYLVGARQAHPGLFDSVAMGRASACDALHARAADLGLRVASIDAHYDVDVAADVVRLAGDLRADSRRAPRTAAVLAAWGV